MQLTIAPPPDPQPEHALLCIRIRDQGGGVAPANIPHIFSYSFTTARATDDDDGTGGGPYAAQHVGGSAALDGSGDVGGSGGSGNSSLFGEIVGRGVQTGMGTIAGLGYGLPMSRLYAM